MRTFEYLKTIPEIEGPTFAFVHILKPHPPFNFDRFGNFIVSKEGFGPEHDTGVPDPYFGQLLFVNGLVLDAVDAILEKSGTPPIIVISADHGRRDQGPESETAILSAYLLPGSGRDVLYPSISPVNTFRVILDHYFDLGLGRLEDRMIPL